MVELRNDLASDWQQATCYLNGEWTALADAKVSVLDRGFIFGDGVYEVIAVDTVDGLRAPFRAHAHFARLQRSLDAVRIDNPLVVEQWLDLTAEVIERNPWPRQLVYVQLTRGVAKRAVRTIDCGSVRSARTSRVVSVRDPPASANR